MVKMIEKAQDGLIKSKVILSIITYSMMKRKLALHQCTWINWPVIGSYGGTPNHRAS
jgi:hypothetical protein